MEIQNIIQLNHKPHWDGYPEYRGIQHHLLMFMDSGSCIYGIGGRRIPVEEGDVLFIAAGVPRSAEPAEAPQTKYSVHWTGDGMHRHFPELAGDARLFRTASLHPYLKQAYSRMRELWTRRDRYDIPLCESILLEVCVCIHREQSTSPGASKQAQRLHEVRDYILAHYREALTIDELAYLIQRNPSHLITSFKKHYGLSPLAYMHRTRMTRAEELLLSSEAGMEAIAEELGYCDAAYFSRMFKRYAGMTPGAYRRQGR